MIKQKYLKKGEDEEDEGKGNAREGFRLIRIMTKLAIVDTLFLAARFSLIFTKMVEGLVKFYG